MTKSDDFKSSSFFKKLQVGEGRGGETQEETTSAINEIKGKVIETKKKVGGESANYKL